HGNRLHGAVRVRVPGRRGAARRIDRGDAGVWVAADVGEGTAGVDRAPVQGEGSHGAVRVRVPAQDGAGGGIEGGDAVARLAADAREAAARVDGGAVQR